MSNPALNNNPALNGKSLSAEELRRIYDQPAAQTQRPGIDTPETTAQRPPIDAPSDKPMTYENTINKIVMLFVLVVAGAAVGWFVPILMIPGVIAGLVLGLVNAFKKEPSPGLIVAYAVAQGLFLGGISGMLEGIYPGIVSQAVIGTLAVFAVTLLLFRSGKVRTSPKATKIFLVAMVGYLAFSVVNVILMFTGVTEGMFGARNITVMGIPLGVIIGVLAVLLAAYSLVMDFEFVQNGVQNRVPEKWGWTAAFGITVTLVWLYLEILRILAILRGD